MEKKLRVRAFAADIETDRMLMSIAAEKKKTISAVVNAMVKYALKHLDDPELQALLSAEKATFTKPAGSLEERARRLMGMKAGEASRENAR